MQSDLVMRVKSKLAAPTNISSQNKAMNLQDDMHHQEIDDEYGTKKMMAS